MFLPFEKWHGCSNDFVVIWLAASDGELVINSLKRQAISLCNRHTGIGADGLLILLTQHRHDLTPYGLLIINSDGSIAKTCGNGLRCAASSVRKRHLDHGNPRELPEMVELLVEGESLLCRFLPGSLAQPLVVVEMGTPTLNSDVPWFAAAKNAWADVATATGAAATIGVCTIGNPHIVLTSEGASRELLLRLGPALQQTPLIDGVNVHLVRALEVTAPDQARAGREIGHKLVEIYEAFVWERGAGETLACGSGACAIAALALDTGLLERSAWVGIDMPGGRLYVHQDADCGSVQLAGPAVFCFSGRTEV